MSKPTLDDLLKDNLSTIDRVEDKYLKGLISEENATKQIQQLRREFTTILVDQIMD